MATYLITLALGPVQTLIDAARRTRDLWAGSWLLNEAAKAAARAFDAQQAGCLIFPAMGAADLARSGGAQSNEANISNILRVQVELADDASARALLNKAKQAAVAAIKQHCAEARKKLEEQRLPFHDDLWQAQIDDILEAFGAWTRVGSGDTAYAEASERLGGLLAARKTTRDFQAAATTAHGLGAGIPKSSLDGARESVLNLPDKDRKDSRYRTALRQLGLAGGEQLDALGIAKRIAGNIEQFTAYSRIAADAWIGSLSETERTSIREAYEPLVKCDLATRASGNDRIYAAFPYDAQLVFGFRLDNALTDPDRDDDEARKLRALRDSLAHIDTQPVPYAAILKADGDRMGELLSRARSAKDARDISRALHEFAGQVRATVRRHRGHAIYAGGDDVLAMVPLQGAFDCARELAACFAKALRGVALQLGVPEGERPTLSIGMGIGHLVEPLGRLRARADEAEHAAKGDGTRQPRNALAIKLGIRSGGETTWRCRWDDTDGLDAMKAFLGVYGETEQCPSRLGYELRDIAQRLDWAGGSATASGGHTALPGIHAAELTRTLNRARQRGGKDTLSATLQTRVANRARQVGLAQLADELIIARWLAARTQSDIGALE